MEATDSTRKPSTFIPVVRNPDGSITRVLHFPTSPPVPDPNSSTTPVLSKDLSLNPLHSTWVRLFLPREALDHSSSSSSSSSKLPLVVYFHGGGFITCSAATWAFHEFCEKMAIRVRAVIVSVEHRLAPEHRLPAAYDDAMDALHWIKSSPEEWLVNFADYSRCFLMGTSSGGNIAYHAGLRAAAVVDDLKPLKIKGLILHDCYFGGTKRTESELRLVDDPSLPLYYNDLQWELSLPISADRDHEYSNPTLDGGSPSWDLFRSLGWRVMITGNDGDPLVGRQVELADALANKGVEVVIHFCQVGRPGQHTLELKDPTAAETFFVIMRNFVYSPVTVSRL
ncbi:hypothetical protein CsSME_00001593 [Camellia sinensis var. sinensis]